MPLPTTACHKSLAIRRSSWKLRKLLKMPVVPDIRSMPVEPLADGTIIGRCTQLVSFR
jgi:hypothetical protein